MNKFDRLYNKIISECKKTLSKQKNINDNELDYINLEDGEYCDARFRYKYCVWFW
jgi:hypothetical protein